jgi:membrane associated rhomboid family serine protease
MALFVAGYAAQVFVDPSPTAGSVERRLGLIPLLVHDGGLHRLLTSLFLHGDLVHLGLVLWGLWWLGGRVERRLGPAVAALACVGGGIAGNLAADLLIPATSNAVGGFSGVLSLAAVHLVHAGGDRATQRRQTVGFLVLVVVLGQALPGVAVAAQVGGFVAGLAYAVTARPDDRASTRTVGAVALTLLVVAVAAAVVHSTVRGPT